MGEQHHARRFRRRDGTAVRAMQFDGRIAGFFGLLTAFPGRILPHPERDDAVLVIMASGGRVRITAGDWVVERQDGTLQTDPDDQFHLAHPEEAIAA